MMDQNQNKEDPVLYCLGSRGSRPVEGEAFREYGGQTTCYILKSGSHAVILDCGSGLYGAGPILADCSVIDAALTHLHYDHILGLLAPGIFPAEAKVTFYGSFAEWLGKTDLNEFFRGPFWPITPKLGKFAEIPGCGVPLELGENIKIVFFPATHPNRAKLIVLMAAGRVICVMFDCQNANDLPGEYVNGCDVLLYDGMFTDEEYHSKAGWSHSTWQEGCRLAERAGAKRLIITHHAPERTDRQLREMEARARGIFAPTYFARSGDRWEL